MLRFLTYRRDRLTLYASILPLCLERAWKESSINPNLHAARTLAWAEAGLALDHFDKMNAR